MLKKLSEKLRAKFPVTKPGCSIVKTAHLNDAFVKVFSPKASLPSGRSITAAKRKEKEKKKRRKKKLTIKKPEEVGHILFQNFFSAHPRATKRDTSGKNGKLSCCKCSFD